MIRSKRILVVFSLASYLLATTAIHALHDHSACGHCCHSELSCEVGACHEDHGDGSNSDLRGESEHHDGHSSPTNCEDSCFACRFLAAKSIAPAVVLPVERFETLCQFVPLPRTLAPVAPVECSLCRGPPLAC